MSLKNAMDLTRKNGRKKIVPVVETITKKRFILPKHKLGKTMCLCFAMVIMISAFPRAYASVWKKEEEHA
jgi:hypothetical protein